MGLIVYTLVLFPLLLAVRAMLLRRDLATDDMTPHITVMIAAYNEERTITARIENLFESDYPRDRIQIVVASDGSTDRTHEIVESFADESVKLSVQPRQGKGRTLSAAVVHADHEILVFTDANTVFLRQSLRALIRLFADPTVGGVAGNQIYECDGSASLTADGERVYWSFDRVLKGWQSAAGNVTSATGAIYAIRRSLFEPVPDDAMDDFMISTGVVAQGKRLVFAKDAVAIEPVAVRGRVEFSRKVRVITQGLRSVLHRRGLLNPLAHGFYALQLVSHKVLRRLLVLPLLVIACLAPLLSSDGAFFHVVAIAEFAFFTSAIAGMVMRPWLKGPLKVLAIPFYVCMVNAAALVALVNTLIGRRIERWEPERHLAETRCVSEGR